MTNPKTVFDDAEYLRRFMLKTKDQRDNSDAFTATLTLPSASCDEQPAISHSIITTTESDHVSEHKDIQGTKTPPRTITTSPDHLTSPEAHPRPSPNISGLQAPHNTPKTAASSPRLAAANTHNGDVAEAFWDYVSKMDGRPLSESMWAPGSARYKPSMLGAAGATRVLTPVKAVDPNPSINDTFDRMSFKAADSDHNVDKNLIGDHGTHSLFSKAPPSFVNKISPPGDKIHEGKAEDVQPMQQEATDEDIEPPAHTDTAGKVQAKVNKASGEDLPKSAPTDRIKKENCVPSTSKAYVPPHLRGSYQEADPSTQSSTQKPKEVVDKVLSAAIKANPSESIPTPTSSDQNPASSKFAVKTETHPPYPDGLSPDMTSKIADPDPVKDAVPLLITQLIAQLQEHGPLTPQHLSVLESAENHELRARASNAHDKDSQTAAGVKAERQFFESNPVQLARQMPYDSQKQVSSALPRVSETETSMDARGNTQSSISSSTVDKATNGSTNNPFHAARIPTNSAETKVTIDLAGGKPLKGASQSEDLEHKAIFDSWPKLEGRSRPAAKIRTVIIKDLPRGSTATFVASIVYGGSLEEIHIRSSAAGDLSAMVRFMDATDCMNFYDKTSNGLVYKKDARGRELVLFVELSKDVDVVGGLLQGWIDSGVTRSVRAVGVEAEWGMDGLEKVAERKNRKVEKIVDGQNPGGARSVVFRFCKVEDAVRFKAALSRDEEWEHCNMHYAADPCALATGVHFEG